MKINLNSDFDKLPFRESRFQYITRKHGNMWNLHRFDHGSDGSWAIKARVLENSVGKPFDEVFSKLCKKYPSPRWNYMKDRFLEEVTDHYSYRGSLGNDYYIDDDGNIQEYERRKYERTISIRSDDYATEERHIVTGHKEIDFEAVYEKIPRLVSYTFFVPYKYITEQKIVYDRGDLLYYRHKTGYIARDEDFEHVVVKGWIKYFNSKNDPEFIKLHTEQVKAKRKAKREKVERPWMALLKDGTDSIIEFKRKQQEKIKREEERNIQTIERLGFDPVTSFRTHRT